MSISRKYGMISVKRSRGWTSQNAEMDLTLGRLLISQLVMMCATILICGMLTPKVSGNNADRVSCTAMAQDVFLSVFSEDPFNTGVWDKYRRGILECGGSPKDLLRTLEDFLGRPPNMNALAESLARAKEER